MKEDNKKTYKIIFSINDKEDLDALSEKCISDLEKHHNSLQLNSAMLKSTRIDGSYIDNSINIRYICLIRKAISAGSGKYLQFSITYAGTNVKFKEVEFEIWDTLLKKMIYRISQLIKVDKAKRSFTITVPFDSNMYVDRLKLKITNMR